MLKFWKNTARGKSKFPTRPPETSQESISQLSTADDFVTPQTHLYNFDNISDNDTNEQPEIQTSRLSKSLQDVLQDKQSLGYFVQFLESASQLPLIEFWIEVENFKDAARILYNQKSSTKLSKPPHQTVIRTVSFDSSIPGSHNSKSKCLLNGYKEIETSIVDSGDSSDMDSLNLRASCSNISTSDHDLKKSLLDNAVKIFKKYIALESPHRLDIPDDIRNTIISSICHPDGILDPDIFKVLQNLVYEQMVTQYFNDFVQSAYHCKFQIDILTSGSLTVEDILYNQMALFYFMEYLEQEQSSLLIEFVMAVINFKEHLQNSPNYDSEQAQNDAIILYDKYFSLQATSSLGFSSEVRFIIEENICKEGGPSPDCFHKPFRLALNVLRQYIPSFLTSQLYYKYLSEMISSIQEGWQPVTKHKKTASDCSSEISISARNTLLATGDISSYRRNADRQSTSMRIDSKQLYNGDLLWRRKADKGLSLGRVNSLGRFESCMEPEPERKDQSVIKRVVSRIVYGEKDKAKEELAWQVAHMIVKDITDVTMGIPENQL